MPYIVRKEAKFKQPKAKKPKLYDRQDAKYYNRWNDMRNEYVRNHPLDELDLLEGKVTATEHVHHCIPFGNYKNEVTKMFFLMCESNFISLSRANHIKVHHHPEELTDKQKEYINAKIKRTQDEYIEQFISKA